MVRRSRHTLIDSFSCQLTGGGYIHTFIDYHKNSRLGYVLHFIVVSPSKCLHHSWKYKDNICSCHRHYLFLLDKYSPD